MPTQDTSKIKEKIISIIRLRGPSLPVHIAKEIGLSILFASAFLSELFHEKKINISNLKIGNSPLYFIPGQESQLEKFSQYLKSKEKDAFILLKDKKFLKDNEQEPAIRVALREINDFAIPFKKNEENYWRYFIIPETEFKPEKPTEKIVEKKEAKQEEEKKEPQRLNIFDKEIKKEKIQKRPRQVKKTKKSKKKNENFFNKVKEFLLTKNIEIIDIQNFNRDNLILKIRENKEEKLLIAYNKKRITEADLLNAYKKSLEENISYIILSLGEAPKKLKTLISAAKSLSEIYKIE